MRTFLFQDLKRSNILYKAILTPSHHLDIVFEIDGWIILKMQNIEIVILWVWRTLVIQMITSHWMKIEIVILHDEIFWLRLFYFGPINSRWILSTIITTFILIISSRIPTFFFFQCINRCLRCWYSIKWYVFQMIQISCVKDRESDI